MKLENLNDFKKLVLLSRKLGLSHIRVGEVEVHLGAEPLKKANAAPLSSSYSLDPLASAKIANNIGYIEDAPPITEELTEDQLLYYSAVSQGDTHEG